MNLVVLSSCSPFDRYVIQRINSHFEVRQVFRVVWTRGKRSRWQNFRQAPLDVGVRFLERKLFGDWRERRLNRAIARQLFGRDSLPPLDGALDVQSHEVNSPGTAEILRSFEPDVLLVTAAPILKRLIYAVPRLATVNIHRGISPQYRGNEAIFWPFFFKDYDHVGVTLHHIDEGIDTGPVLAQGFMELERTDTEASLLAKGAKLAAELVLEYLSLADERPRGKTIQATGRAWSMRERRVWHDLHLLMRRAMLRSRPPCRPSRVELHLRRILKRTCSAR